MLFRSRVLLPYEEGGRAPSQWEVRLARRGAARAAGAAAPTADVECEEEVAKGGDGDDEEAWGEAGWEAQMDEEAIDVEAIQRDADAAAAAAAAGVRRAALRPTRYAYGQRVVPVHPVSTSPPLELFVRAVPRKSLGFAGNIPGNRSTCAARLERRAVSRLHRRMPAAVSHLWSRLGSCMQVHILR